MKLIGIEEHFLTLEVRKAWEAIGLEATDPSVAFHSGAIEGRLLDLAEDRIALMDETGLDIQVLSLTTPGLHDLGRDSLDLARRINDALGSGPINLRVWACHDSSSRTGSLRDAPSRTDRRGMGDHRAAAAEQGARGGAGG